MERKCRLRRMKTPGTVRCCLPSPQNYFTTILPLASTLSFLFVLAQRGRMEITMTKYFQGIPYSDYVSIAESGAGPIISIKSPGHNMQTDAACFEALALVIKAKAKADTQITIQYTPLDWKGTFDADIGAVTAKDPANKQLGHYMRFLYRLWRFTSIYPWAKVAEEAQKDVDLFCAAIGHNKDLLKNAVPSSNSEYNPAKGLEHEYEKWFVDKRNLGYLNMQFQTGISTDNPPTITEAYDQFPNGLFFGEVKRDHRIFPTGFFDLWGTTSTNDICLFELKKSKGNAKLGIISELFFYATYLRDFICGNISHAQENKSTYRGYDKMLQLAKSRPKIYASFLVASSDTGCHAILRDAAIREQVLKLLNHNNFNIQYSFTEYDAAILERGIMQRRGELQKTN